MYNGKVTKIKCNWRQSSIDDQYGEDYDVAEIGRDGVVDIKYHEPQGEGDKHYCDVTKADGTIYREFNLNQIKIEPQG
jgi:hypothetical protein